MLNYNEFWEALLPAYPVSKGKFHLPIATKLEDFGIEQKDIITELDNIMQQLFKKNEEAKILAKKGYAPGFVDCYREEFTGIVRFDLMFDQNNTLKVVEANTNWPDGLLMHDVTYGVLAGEENNTHLDLFLQFFDQDENIFILYEEGMFLDPHYLEYYKLKEYGYQVGIGLFSDLSFQAGGVYFEGKKVDCIRLSMNSGRFDEEEYQLLAKSGIRFINTFDLAGLADKSLLEGIESKMLMKTELLSEENQEKIKMNKNNYVLKPRNLNEGIGVMIGIDTEQADWEQAIDAHLDENYLVQEYITVQNKKTNMYHDGEVVESLQYYDYCPHLFYHDGKLIGVGHTLVRYSPNKIVNVMRGGGIGYAKMGNE